MSRPLLGILLVCVFVAALVVSIPARILSLVVPSDQLILNGYSGTLWHGQAARCALATGGGYFQLGTVEWSLNPLSLLLFSPSVNVRSHWGKQKISGQVQVDGRRSFALDNVEASVSARVLQRFLPVAVDGDFSATISHLLIVDSMPIGGEGRLMWRSAGWLTSQGTTPLGSYALDFNQAQNSALQGTVVTINGPVEASGNVTLTDENYDLDVLLSRDGGLSAPLKQALSLIAQPVAEGYRIVLKGQLRELE